MSDILPVLLCMILFQDGFAVTVEHLVHFQHGISVGQCIENDALLGTAIYAAPEQFGLSRSDARTDIYAMGILMNELLTGLHPAVTRYEAGPLKDVITRCTPYEDALAWDEPVFAMTFDNPDGGDAVIDVISNHNSLTFYFEEE